MRNFDLDAIRNTKGFIPQTEALLAAETNPKLAEFIRLTHNYIAPLYNLEFNNEIEYLEYDSWVQARDCFRSYIYGSADLMLTFYYVYQIMKKSFNDTLPAFHPEATSQCFLYLATKHVDLFDLTCSEIKDKVDEIMMVHKNITNMVIHLSDLYYRKEENDKSENNEKCSMLSWPPIKDPETAAKIANVIIFASLNCMPLYDEKFKKGLREFGIDDNPGKKSLLELCSFYEDNNLDDFYGRKFFKIETTKFSQMKYLYTGFYEIGCKSA